MRWKPIKQYTEELGLKDPYLYVNVHNKVIPPIAIKGSRPKLIDTEWYQRRLDFRVDVMNHNQELFFELQDKMPVARISEFMAKKTNTHVSNWVEFVYYEMWKNNPSKGVFRVSKRHWQFYRLAKWLLKE